MTNQPLTDPGYSPDDFVRGYLTAFEQVYAAYHPGLLRFARELVQDATVSENIVTDNFLKAWIKHADLDSRQNIEAFLQIGVQRACLSYLKQVEQLSNTQLQYLQELATRGAAETPGVKVSIGEKDSEAIKSIITGWFAKLPFAARRIARLVYIDALSDEQAAKQLNLTAEQVKEQKAQALLLIREQWLIKTEMELAAFRDMLKEAARH